MFPIRSILYIKTSSGQASPTCDLINSETFQSINSDVDGKDRFNFKTVGKNKQTNLPKRTIKTQICMD